jgi:radical SAM superfamily enzyme YgiQ (UPF0313 family)
MKFLLIKPGLFEDDSKNLMLDPSTLPPLGLLYLGAVLEKDGHKVEILDYSMKNIPKEKLKNAVLSADAVGMSVCTDINFNPYLNISKAVKELDPDIPLIIGGPHCTFVKKQSLDDIPKADISVVGEGEYVIPELVKNLQGEKNLADIKGIYYRNNGSIHQGKPLEVICNLDDLPFPARHLVENYDYGDFPFGFQMKKKVTSMITSRGCPYKCRFCARYSNFIDGFTFRQRSADNILKEFSEIDDKYRSVSIVDDSFLADKKRANKIFDGLIEMRRDFDLWIYGTRVDFADKMLYKKMKKAGVKIIFFGIESGNQDTLDFYNKKTTVEQIRRAVKLSRKMNFLTIGSFILGAPNETKEHIENTIKFACSIPIDFAGFGPLRYIRGSQLWDEAVENNKIPKDSKEIFYFGYSENGLGNFTQKELMDYTLKAFQSFYFRPSYMIKEVYRSILRNDFSLISSGLNLLFSMKKQMGIYKNFNPSEAK